MVCGGLGGKGRDCVRELAAVSASGGGEKERRGLNRFVYVYVWVCRRFSVLAASLKAFRF